MARHHFLCCLPLRLGAALFSFLMAAANIAVAALLWDTVITHAYLFENSKTKVVAYVVAVYYSIIGLIALFGFLGAVFGVRKLVSPYATMLIISLFLQIAISIWYIVAILTESRTTFVNNCMKDSHDSNINDTCNRWADARKWAQPLIVGVPLLISIYVTVIVNQYKDQLRDKEFEEHTMGSYKGRESMEGLRGSKSYPYTGASNSFGSGSPGYAHGGV